MKKITLSLGKEGKKVSAFISEPASTVNAYNAQSQFIIFIIKRACGSYVTKPVVRIAPEQL